MVNFKGGSAKSVSAIHLAYSLSARGPVLYVDLDNSADATESLLSDYTDAMLEAANAFTYLTGETKLGDSIFKGEKAPFSVLPATLDLFDLSYEATKKPSIMRKLYNDLPRLNEERAAAGQEPFQFAIIDIPGNPQVEAPIAMLTADVILITVTPRLWAVKGVRKVLDALRDQAPDIIDLRGAMPSIKILYSGFGKSKRHQEILGDLRATVKSLEKDQEIRESFGMDRLNMSGLPEIPSSDSIVERAESGLALPKNSSGWTVFEDIARKVVKA